MPLQRLEVPNWSLQPGDAGAETIRLDQEPAQLLQHFGSLQIFERQSVNLLYGIGEVGQSPVCPMRIHSFFRHLDQPFLPDGCPHPNRLNRFIQQKSPPRVAGFINKFRRHRKHLKGSKLQPQTGVISPKILPQQIASTDQDDRYPLSGDLAGYWSVTVNGQLASDLHLLRDRCRLMTIGEVAVRLGVLRPHLSRLLNGHAAMTAEMAIRVAMLTGTTPVSHNGDRHLRSQSRPPFSISANFYLLDQSIIFTRQPMQIAQYIKLLGQLQDKGNTDASPCG